MGNPKVLITNGEIPQDALDLLIKKRYELVVCPELPYPTREQILQRAEGVNAIFWASKERVDKEVLDVAGANLKVVATMSAGYNHIDVEEIKSRGIKVGNTPRVLNAAVAEMAITLLLATARRLQEGRQKIENGEWEIIRPQWMLGQDLQGSTVGIMGLGGIGQAVASRLKPFQVSRLLYTGHKPKPQGEELGAQFVSFDDLLAESDFVIITCPLTDETRGIFNANTFSKMKSNAVLVNVSRGDVVDQPSLVQALELGQIWGAGLDVMTPEPLPQNHPLLGLHNCVLAPHLGSATLQTRSAMAMLTANNIITALEGNPMPASL